MLPAGCDTSHSGTSPDATSFRGRCSLPEADEDETLQAIERQLPKLPQAVPDRGVVIDVNAEVEELLISTRDGLTIEALRLPYQGAFEELLEPRRLRKRVYCLGSYRRKQNY